MDACAPYDALHGLMDACAPYDALHAVSWMLVHLVTAVRDDAGSGSSAILLADVRVASH